MKILDFFFGNVPINVELVSWNSFLFGFFVFFFSCMACFVSADWLAKIVN